MKLSGLIKVEQTVIDTLLVGIIFITLRLYARGEQSVQKYKDELSINGDLSYLNLDWKPVPVISKFVNIVVNGISNKEFDIKAYSQDPESVKKEQNMHSYS